MKTLRNIHDGLSCFENVWGAYVKARRGKRYGEPAAHFDRQAEANVLRLCEELRTGRYRPGPYHHFYITEPKRRKISAAPFRDRVVHHALVNVLEPYYEARFSAHSYACRVGKGGHAAMEQAHWGVRNTSWMLKGDLVKFFPSVDHEVLLELLFSRVRDRRTRELMARIVETGAGVLEEEMTPHWFPGDDLLSPVTRPRGLPIGNLTSQFFANVLLNEMDQWVHREIKPVAYVRYSDDFLLFDRDKGKLREARVRLEAMLTEMRLRLHPSKTCVRPCAQGVRFLGFRLLPQTRRVSRESLSRFRSRMRSARAAKARGEEVDYERISASVRGWLAHQQHANTRAVVNRLLWEVHV